jgi:TatD DNase family protein
VEWIDTHCHLTFPPLVDNLEGVLYRTQRAGVSVMVAAAFDRQSWDALDTLPVRECLLVAYGVHPWAADEGCDLDALRQRAGSDRCVAIGEIGLDFGPSRPLREVQRSVFADQLGLAAELDLPVVVHCVKAFDVLFDHLAAVAKPVRGVIHGYNGSPELAERCLRAGLLIGLGARLTERPNKKLLSALSGLPPGGFVVETDAPEGRFASAPRGLSEPCQVVEVGRVLAQRLGWPLEQVAIRTTENARQLFSIG